SRELAHWARQPGAVIANTLLFPVMIVLMFGYLLGGAMTVPGGGDYRDFLMPGIFAMTMVFGIGATVTAVSADAARGVTGCGWLVGWQPHRGATRAVAARALLLLL